MSGVGGVGTNISKDYNESDTITVIQERSEISDPTIRVENMDLKKRTYKGDKQEELLWCIDKFREYVGYSKDTKEQFFESTKRLYRILKDYRDLLISERYVSGKAKKVNVNSQNPRSIKQLTEEDGEADSKNVNGEEKNELEDRLGLGMYFFFLRILALFVSAVSIKDFTFNGNVLNFANFYNSTLTNVSFYGTQFYHTIFARAKLYNVIMDLSEVDNVFFYYTKLSNTSLSNSVFSYVDFEHIQMQNCDLSICEYSHCSINNSSLVESVFNGSKFFDAHICRSDFSHSKLWGILFTNVGIEDCDFTGADIQEWKFVHKKELHGFLVEDRNGIAFISNCNFSSSAWDKMTLSRVDLTGSAFDDALLVGVEFTQSNWPDKDYLTPKGKYIDLDTNPYRASTDKVYMYFSGTVKYTGDSNRILAGSEKARPVYENSYVTEAVNYISKTYAEAIGVAEIAEHVGISRAHLNHAFQEELNVSVQNYLMDFRMRKAANLLAETKQPIKAISDAVGYADQLVFSKAFKKKYGMSPKNYRFYQNEMERRGDEESE